MIKINNSIINENKILFKSIIESNIKGWMDDFSKKHFLIKALDGKMDYFQKYSNLIENSVYFETNYCKSFLANFSHRLNLLFNVFNEKDMRNFFNSGLSAGKSNYDDAQFFRSLSEAMIMEFLITYGPSRLKQAIYEPKLGENGKNPEARFIYDCGITIDVEVKTPGFNKSSNKLNKVIIPAFLLDAEDEKVFKKVSSKYNCNFLKPRVLKLKEFINSAGDKFVKPQDSNHINLLYINWTYSDIEISGLKEPYGLLYNNYNGILKNMEAALSIGIKEKALEKITAIIVYQDSFESIIFNDFRDVWNGYKFRLMPNCLMKSSLIDYNKISNATRMKPPMEGDMLSPFLGSIPQSDLDEAFEVLDILNKHVKSRIKQNRNKIIKDNFAYFTREFYQNELKKQIEYYKTWGKYLIPRGDMEKQLKNIDMLLTL
ncbi:MAG: hypothetical protein LKF87_10055 [Clostridium tyrobutyricum]|jgi:hypothetical protein|uniref:hypothetical protein n=2 Tax=Clostridium tyrobutyricum TaxID=1519 RepID=UPI00242B2208|nr:hypothetical protein [Clostridium tyrobutyricum]MCH4201317.1 hypothetical protein [Clostridium tyrobutyricum]MCH4259292.1 hypothetical protein [Clostridium tyrobutyricum]